MRITEQQLRKLVREEAKKMNSKPRSRRAPRKRRLSEYSIHARDIRSKADALDAFDEIAMYLGVEKTAYELIDAMSVDESADYLEYIARNWDI